MRLHIRLLGQFGVTLDGYSVEGLGAVRLQTLLAYLVLHRHGAQSRTQLAFLFWPDAAESNARNNLRQLLHQLRQTVPDADQLFHVDARSVRWQSVNFCDVDVETIDRAVAEAEDARETGDAPRRLRSLERAIGSCGGTLLPECYDDWIVPERERVARQCKQVAQQLVNALEAARDYAGAIPHVQHWLAHDPTDEEAYRWLMRLHALCGERSAALQAFRQCCDVLRRELDAEPNNATMQLHERIRVADSAFAQAEHRPHASEAPLPLVGRDAEWEALRGAWDRAAAGSAGIALIVGEAGIGKSRLAAELVSWAERQGFGVATSRCYAAEGQLPLAPVTDWLRSTALRTALASVDDLWLAEVARIVPELTRARPELQPAPMTDLGHRQRLFEGLAHATLATGQPVLLVIDDLQWADPETLQWLHFLLRFERSAPVLVVATVRPENVAPPLPVHTFLLDLRRESAVTEIELEALDAVETAQLAAHVANRSLDSESALRLYGETEGNPLFVVEVIRSDASSTPAANVDGTPLPPRVQAVIAGRLAQLSPTARHVVCAAAVIGRAWPLSVLSKTLGCSELELVAPLDELWHKRIVREQSPNHYDFTHDKLREVAYDESSAPQRRALHLRVAQALAVGDASDVDRASAQIAAHYDRSGLAEEAIPYYLRAAGVAQAVYANGEAQALIERGLALLETLPETHQRDVWALELALALAPIYRVTRGWPTSELETVLMRARALCEQVGTPAQQVKVLYGLQSLYLVQGKHERAEELTDEIVELLRRTPGAEPPRSAVAMMVGLQLVRARFQEAIEAWDSVSRSLDPVQLQHLQESQGLNYRVIAHAWESHALWCVGLPETALARCREAVQLALDLAQPFNQALAATYLALLQQLRADLPTFRGAAQEALRLSDAFQAPYYKSWAAILVAYANACDAPSASAVVEVREAIDRFTGTGARLRLPYYLALLADACLRAHDPAGGLLVLDEASAGARDGGERWWDAELSRLRGDLLLARGADAEDADRAYRDALEIAHKQGALSLELRAATARARLWRGSSRAAGADCVLERTLGAFTQGFDTPDLTAARALLEEPAGEPVSSGANDSLTFRT